MKVLIYGGGAREHALAWKIKSSPLLSELYLYKANDGFSDLGIQMNANSLETLAIESQRKGINLLIVGPEAPLIEGIVDEFNKVGIPAIGPDKKWAMLEGSKSFAKEFMIRNNIPTGHYILVTQKNEIKKALKEFSLPIVLKADGLASGKGVAISHDFDEAENIVEKYLNGQFGEASKKVVVEEFLEGAEISLISLWDGENLLPFITARDYKKLHDGNKGPNTGGMGSYCPVELTDVETNEINEYISVLQRALISEKADFTGVIYSGLILTTKGIKVLEYNMRFGDPETQSLLTHLESDLLYVFDMTVKKQLNNVNLKWKEGISFCVVVASYGYPYKPVNGGEISNIRHIKEQFNVNVFYAGVEKKDKKLLASGGRVLSICKNGINPEKDVYAAINELSYEDKCYRTDIGA